MQIAGVDAAARREIESAQGREAYRIAGERLARVPFGRERAAGPTPARCPDCGAGPGELHVPGCEVEQCPACGGRVISCDCAYGPAEGGPSMA